MKIILIRPPSRLGVLASHMVHEPLNLTGIAAYLIVNDYKDIEIWDFEVEKFEDRTFIEKVRQTSPHIIGISCMTPLIVSGHYIAGLIKKASSEIIVVVGGAHPSLLPLETLKEFPNFDVAVFGEGEETMTEICHRIKKKISFDNVSGLAYRQGQEIIINKPRAYIADLDKLPFPDRNLINIQRYEESLSSPGSFSKNIRKISIFASRGCPYNCTFCEVKYLQGRKIRYRSVGNVMGEIIDCTQKYNANYFTFKDDTLTMNSEFIKGICKELKRINVNWDCKTRVNLITKEMLAEMVESGCKKIFLGVESGSPRILKLIGKNITIDQVKNAFSWAKDLSLETTAYFMIGSHPSENMEDINLTTKLLKEIEPDYISLSIFTPFPKTEATELMHKKGLIDNWKWEDFMFGQSNLSWRTEHFSSKELINIRKKILIKYYLNPSFILKKVKRIRNLSDLKYWFKTGVNFLIHVYQK